MTVVRVDSTVQKVVDALEAHCSPVKSWLHSSVHGANWSVTPYEGYLKVRVPNEKIATILLLTI